jgi:ketol-acid reductoisomerase
MSSREPKIISDKQIKLDLLKNMRLGILGYGSQGRAQALNLRDSGFEPVIGLLSNSRSRKLVKEDGLEVSTPARVCRNADVIAILIPDHKHKELFEDILYPAMRPGQTFIFAHGLSVHFRLVKQPDNVDFILVAPHGPGIRLRQRFLDGRGLTAFIARSGKSSKQSLKLAAAYAKAIGCSREGIIVTDFGEEAVGDIFGEQAVLCGGLSALMKAGFNTLVRSGLPPENAYLECIYQIDLIVDLIKKYGIDGMYERISTTAAFGSVMAESKLFGAQSDKAFVELLKDIQTGEFMNELMADYKNDFKKYKSARKKVDMPSLDKVARYFADKFDIQTRKK